MIYVFLVALYIMIGAQVALMIDKNLEFSWMFGVFWPIVVACGAVFAVVWLCAQPIIWFNK